MKYILATILIVFSSAVSAGPTIDYTNVDPWTLSPYHLAMWKAQKEAIRLAEIEEQKEELRTYNAEALTTAHEAGNKGAHVLAEFVTFGRSPSDFNSEEIRNFRSVSPHSDLLWHQRYPAIEPEAKKRIDLSWHYYVDDWLKLRVRSGPKVQGAFNQINIDQDISVLDESGWTAASTVAGVATLVFDKFNTIQAGGVKKAIVNSAITIEGYDAPVLNIAGALAPQGKVN